MAKTEEPLTQLATRIPKDLHRRLKLYCVTHDIALMHFVVEAIEEKLGRKTRPKKAPAPPRRARCPPGVVPRRRPFARRQRPVLSRIRGRFLDSRLSRTQPSPGPSSVILLVSTSNTSVSERLSVRRRTYH